MMVKASDFMALLPLIILAGFTIVVMLSVAIRRSQRATAALTLIGLAGAFRSLWLVTRIVPHHVTPLLILDHYALFYIGLILAATMAITLLSYGYFSRTEGDHEEFYVLLLAGTLGACILTAANHFVSFFLGLELLSVSLYAMIAYLDLRFFPVEAGIKYLVLAAVSTAFLLFGMALVYMTLGTMEFGGMVAASRSGEFSRPLLLSGIALIVTGFGFKLALVPFHLWTPDVNQGAPAPVAAYIATISKGAMFALLLRYFESSGARAFAPVAAIFAIIAIASMFTGNILALLQNNVKRILAYSSIAHLGYLLVAFLAGGSIGSIAVTFYLAAYFITMTGAFGVVAVLSTGSRDAEEIEDYRGLFWQRPFLAAVFTVMLLSLAGIPVTAGFIGKFYIVAAGASAATWALILILAVTSAMGLFYYLRLIIAMYDKAPAARPLAGSVAPAGSIALAILTVALLFLGLFPTPLLDAIRSAITDLA
jgi:NADH-quinone oxidoreductase subunit N